MKKKYILISLIFIFLAIFCYNNKTYAANLDQIIDYEVKVDPRMNDATLDITYKIKWKVLDSTTEGPLEWVQIGTPNEYFDNATALTNNIRSISKYNGSFVKIVFKKKYYEGEQLTFKYSIHQKNMCKTTLFGKCKYEFTPAWFTNARVDNLTVLWNADSVKGHNAKSKKDNYLVWNKKSMPSGSKLKLKVTYNKNAFSSISNYKKSSSNYGRSMSSEIILFVIIIVLSVVLPFFDRGDRYYSHRGFYGGYGRRYYGGGCVRSSCACAHSSCASSCACACAGSGRAGCSRKDFYGTNLTSQKIHKVMNKKKS